MHFPFKQMFVKKKNTDANKECWRRLLRILMINRRQKSKKKMSSNAEFNIVRFRLSQQPAICFDCKIMMGSHIALYQHCRTQHPKSLVNALCCDAEYYTFGALAAHCESAHSGQHICISCRAFFGSAMALKSHMSQHEQSDGIFAYFCIVCGTFKNTIEDIESHLRSDHDVDDGEEPHYVCWVPQLALEITTRLERAENQEKSSDVPPVAHTPTLKDCIAYSFDRSQQAV